VDPVPDPLLLRKSGSAGNRTQTSASVAKNSDHQITEAVHQCIMKNLIILQMKLKQFTFWNDKKRKQFDDILRSDKYKDFHFDLLMQRSSTLGT
jgi:hypothetical protein